MITLGLPWLLGMAVFAAMGVTLLHLLSVQRPPSLRLPTTRFLPERTVRAVSRTKHVSDVRLLLLRVAGLLLAGLAVARPEFVARGATHATLAVVSPTAGERTQMGVTSKRSSADTAAIRQLIGAHAASGGASADGTSPQSQVVFADNPTMDASTVWPLAWHAAAQLVNRQAALDSVSLHLVVGTEADTMSAAWRAWAAGWPGRVVVHGPVRPAIATTTRRQVHVEWIDGQPSNRGRRAATIDDAADRMLRDAFRWHAVRVSTTSRTGTQNDTGTDTVLVSRDTSVRGRAATSGRAEGSTGRVVRIYWPINGVPAKWTQADALAERDEAERPTAPPGALVTNGVALSGPWQRSAVPPFSDERTASDIVWWSDGSVAAREARTAAGCERVIAVDVSHAAIVGSDVLMAAAANALFDRLLSPCHPRVAYSLALLTALDTVGTSMGTSVGTSTAAASAFRRVSDRDGGAARARRGQPGGEVGGEVGGTVRATTVLTEWIVPVLLAMAVLLFVIEGRVRERATGAGDAT